MRKPPKCSRSKQATTCKKEAYVPAAGWLGCGDDKVRRLTPEALQQGSNHFKMKVGVNVESDLHRGEIIRVDLTNLSKGRKSLSASSIDEKNVGPTGNVLIIDGNQV